MTCWSIKAIIFQVFDHFGNSPTNYRFFDTCLIASYQEWEENWNSHLNSQFNTWTLCFTRKDLCFSTCRQVVYKKLMFIVWTDLAFDPRRKNDISSYISPRSFIQTAKCSLLDEKIVYQSFYGASLTFSYFLLQGKVLCFGSCVGKSLARCLLSKAFRTPCRKNYISGYIWHKSFIQTVKCSFFNQIIVYQSFYGVPLTFSYFLLQGKVLFFTLRSFGKSLARCCLQSVPKTLPKKFYLRLYLTQTFIQTVKCSFLNQTIGYQSFYSALLTFSYFNFTSRKSYVFRHASASCLFWRTCQKSYISGSIWHESFIEMVKYSFSDEIIVYRRFLNINIITKRLLPRW